jgi:uncharacterized metal-binding protein YceD (DUF177 family)
MDLLNTYKINLVSLENGLHTYEFEVKDEFFSNFEDSLLSQGNIIVKLNLTKQINLLIAEFKIEGSIKLICDRSLEEFDYLLNRTYTIHFKYADDFEEISDEIIHIPFGLPQLDLSQYIYEYIGLSVPMRKIHPKFADEDSEEESEVIYSSEVDETEEDIDIVDPRWATLKNLKK